MSNDRFQKARKRLSEALKSLEDITKEKIHETAMQKGIVDNNRAIEESIVIQNLNKEVNNLQQNLEELGDELELANRKNKTLTEKINNYRSKGFSLVNAIETDLARIEDIIKQNEEL